MDFSSDTLKTSLLIQAQISLPASVFRGNTYNYAADVTVLDNECIATFNGFLKMAI